MTHPQLHRGDANQGSQHSPHQIPSPTGRPRAMLLGSQSYLAQEVKGELGCRAGSTDQRMAPQGRQEQPSVTQESKEGSPRKGASGDPTRGRGLDWGPW